MKNTAGVNEYNRIAMMVKCRVCRRPVSEMCVRSPSFVNACHSIRYIDGLALQKQMQLNVIDETA